MNQKLADYIRAKEYTDRVKPENNIQELTYEIYEKIVNEFESKLPKGSGICGTKIIKATNKIIEIKTSYHHMDEHGFYDGWTEHKIKIVPTFSGEYINISGRNRNDIKDYLHEIFSQFIN